jgi:recombinational DNA repair protein (RecF pathway)
MSYQTYITDALVCGVQNSNTSDRSFLLFTREAGMLFASARSVREEKSKQRYALQEFSLVRVTLIKGKAGWRIGSVEAIANFYHDAKDKLARGSVVGIVRQLKRFIHGEESVAELFDFTLEALRLVTGPLLERAYVDKLIQLRIMYHLGYVSAGTVAAGLLSTPLATTIQTKPKWSEKQLDNALKTAVSASHL